jgi:hypothetical protein
MLVDIVQELPVNQDLVPGAGQTQRSDAFYTNNNMRQAASTKPVTGASEVAAWSWNPVGVTDSYHKGICLAAAGLGISQGHILG